MASTRQVAQKLKISESTLKRLEARGEIPRIPRLPVGPRVYKQEDITTIKNYLKKKKH